MSTTISDSETPQEFSGEALSSSSDSIDDSLRLLRSRRMQMEASPWSNEAEEAPAIEEASEIASLDVISEENNSEVDHAEEEELAGYDIIGAIEELSQESRRVGREIYKTNRTAERNQEIFSESLDEIRQLAAVIRQVSTQNAAALDDVKFDARAEICRELLRMVDTLNASLAAADELVLLLEAKSAQKIKGLAFYLAAARELYASVEESAEAVRQWRDGQHLLAKRLHAVLQTAGVRPIDAVGHPFDPARHRAVSAVARTDEVAGTIIGEELKGYTLNGRILRYSEVIVAKHE